MSAEAWVLGLHLLTAHSNHALQAQTPGLYVQAPSGLVAGVLRNSYGLASVYGGYSLQTEDRRFALTVGAITGYPARPVLPLVVPSVRVGLGGSAALRLSLLPRLAKVGTGYGVHVSLEVPF